MVNVTWHKIINFLKTLRFLFTYWKTYLIQFDLIIFFFFFKYEEIGKSCQKFSTNKRADFKFWMWKKYIKISEKIITILASFLLDINILPANFFIDLQSFIELKKKFNNVYYKNYLPRNKSSWLHNIYSLFGNMNLQLPEELFSRIKFIKNQIISTTTR